MGFQQYDPARVKVTMGPAVITGFGPDTFLSIEFREDLFTFQVGADGEMCRSKSNNLSADATLTLMPGSSSNLVLSALLIADKAAGLGVVPFGCTDLSTGTTHGGLEAWVSKDPTKVYGKEGQMLEWKITIAKCQAAYGASV